MTIERATARYCEKAWGRTNLQPWSKVSGADRVIGEMSFERPEPHASRPALLFKLLFTSAALSIQVHPDDCFAERIGLTNGKAEAWYILSAEAGARVALGLKHPMTRIALRAALMDGSIESLVRWQPVKKGDVISVPPGTIHAIGPGVVIAEIQQNSDTTYRLFDYGSLRDLHIDQGMAVADAEIFHLPIPPAQLCGERRTLVVSPHFVFEYIDLASNESREISADNETWMLVTDGSMIIGDIEVTRGEAILIDGTTAKLQVGDIGLTALIAYASSTPSPDLLRPVQTGTMLRPVASSVMVASHE